VISSGCSFKVHLILLFGLMNESYFDFVDTVFEFKMQS
jgi:hypothetical protein